MSEAEGSASRPRRQSEGHLERTRLGGTDPAAEHGFVDVGHTVEIFGTCGDCAAERR